MSQRIRVKAATREEAIAKALAVYNHRKGNFRKAAKYAREAAELSEGAAELSEQPPPKRRPLPPDIIQEPQPRPRYDVSKTEVSGEYSAQVPLRIEVPAPVVHVNVPAPIVKVVMPETPAPTVNIKAIMPAAKPRKKVAWKDKDGNVHIDEE